MSEIKLERPTLRQIFERTEQDLGGSLLYSTRRIFSKAISGCAHLLYGYARKLANNLHPLWAEGEILDLWAKIWLETGRKQASPSKGSLVVEATSEITLPAGTLFRYGGLEFRTMKPKTFSGTREIQVEAILPGKIRSIEPGEQLTAVQTIPYLTATALVADKIGGGVNRESDESLRERILERVRNPAQGGSPQDYIVWAKEVPGISRAWVAPKMQGRGTVGLAFVDDNNGGVPTAAARDALLEKLEADAPAATSFVPVMLEAEPVHFVIRADPVSIEPQMEAELKTLIRNTSEPRLSGDRYFLDSRRRKTTGTLTVSDIHEALALITKNNYKILSPTEDLTVSEGKIFTFGGLRVEPY